MYHRFVRAALAVWLLSAPSHALVQVFPRLEIDSFDLRSPNYFITGFGSERSTDEPSLLAGRSNQVKFRINVNFRLADWRSTRTGLFLGYSQLSFWNIYDPSSPFLDNNYRPELFVYFDAGALERPAWYKPSLKLALAHESNGMAGERDRGWDRVIETIELGHPPDNRFFATLSLWQVLNRSAREDSYTRYLGNGSLGLHWRLPFVREMLRLGFSAVSRFIYGAPFVASLELSAYANPFSGFQTDIRWLPSFMVQYFVGTGENLLNYRTRSSALRLGIAFVR